MCSDCFIGVARQHAMHAGRGIVSPVLKFTKFHIFFTVKFRKDLREKLELKLPAHLTSVAALPCEKQVVNYAA